jgi:uncharacterized protein
MGSDIDIEIKDNPARRRIEAHVDGRISFIDYRLLDDQIIYYHTEVPIELGGRGVGGKMARFAFELARSRGLKVVPRCSFVAGYLRRHPEYQDLVD